MGCGLNISRLRGCLQVLYREYAAGMYAKMPFALSLCCVEIPYNTLEAALFSIVCPKDDMSKLFASSFLLSSAAMLLCCCPCIWQLFRPASIALQIQHTVKNGRGAVPHGQLDLLSDHGFIAQVSYFMVQFITTPQKFFYYMLFM